MKDVSLNRQCDRGASMVEYGLLVALIALMSLSALTLLGNKTEGTFTTVAAALDEEGAPDSNDHQGDGGQNGDENDDQGQGGQNGDDDDDQGQGGQNDDDDSHDQQDDDQDDQDNGGDQGDDQGDDQNDQDNGDDQGDDQDDQDNGGDQADDQGDDQDDQQGDDPGSDDDEDEAEDQASGPSSNPLASASDFTWWNSTKHGGNGAWRAAVSYGNETNRHQYLTLEVTKIDETGRRTTITVNGFYVAANGSATFSQWDNQLQAHKGNISGIVEVQVKVTKIATSDQNWQSFSYDVDDDPVSLDPPAIP